MSLFRTAPTPSRPSPRRGRGPFSVNGKLTASFSVKKFIALAISCSLAISPLRAAGLFSWDFPGPAKAQKHYDGQKSQTQSDSESEKPSPFSQSLPIQYLSAEFDPAIEPGMILAIEVIEKNEIGGRHLVPILSEKIVTVPGLGVLEIDGKNLGSIGKELQNQTNREIRVGLILGSAQTVQVLGKVQKPGNYPGYARLSFILAEAFDRIPGSNFKVLYYNGATRELLTLNYEEIVKGKRNPFVPPASIIYLPPSAGAIFGEMTEKQVNLAYLIVITLGALGITAIVRQ